MESLKIATLIRCYHATEFLERVLKNYSWVDKILIMNYRFKSVKPISDDTAEIAAKFSNTEVIKGQGIAQHDILNLGLQKLADYDYVFISDADEFIFPAEQKLMVKTLHDRGKDYGFCMIKDYLYDINHCMPQRHGHFVTIVKPGKTKFVHIRRNTFVQEKRQDFHFLVHHLGFALNPTDLAWKMKWESVEERTNVAQNVKRLKIVDCVPPPELLAILK